MPLVTLVPPGTGRTVRNGSTAEYWRVTRFCLTPHQSADFIARLFGIRIVPVRRAVRRHAATGPYNVEEENNHPLTMKKLPAKWIASLLDVGRQVLDAFRWRGPLSFLLLTVREIFKPVVYWHVFYILENDLTHQPPILYAKKRFVVRFYQGETEIAGVGPELSALGELTVDEILVRAQRGDLVAVAFAGTEPVGYSWMSRSSELPLVFNATWVMHANEAVLYGSFVRPKWRGKGIHNWLDLALNARAREDGLVRTIGSMAVFNRQTLALAKHTKKSRMMIVALARVRGFDCPWVMAHGSPFGSRFRLDGSSAEKIAESFPRPANELNVP